MILFLIASGFVIYYLGWVGVAFVLCVLGGVQMAHDSSRLRNQVDDLESRIQELEDKS